MKEVKYWTINCGLLDDQEFEEFVGDVERFIGSVHRDYLLPQDNSEQWLGQFVESYNQWPDRKFTPTHYPLHSYFAIDTRLGAVAA